MTGSSERSYGEWYCALIAPIRSFLASHYSRRDSEMWRLLDVIISTNPTDTFILSQKTKSSVPPKPWDKPRRAGCLTVRRRFGRTEQDKDRTGQGNTVQDDDRRGCFPPFSPSDILVDRTGVSVMPSCPISQRTFVWLSFNI